MKPILILWLFSITALVGLAQDGPGHKNELAFGLGGMPGLSRSDTPVLDVGAGIAFQVNYGRRFMTSRLAALYGEINMLANPLRDVSSSVATATSNFATLYITPGIRVKFLPASRVSPYAVIGGGYADYEQSTSRIDGQPNTAPRELGRGVFDVGAGVDVKVWRFLYLRAEARDFFTGSPGYNLAAISGGQHNVTATGAFVLAWH